MIHTKEKCLCIAFQHSKMGKKFCNKSIWATQGRKTVNNKLLQQKNKTVGLTHVGIYIYICILFCQ